jgi:hypothetical protein
LSRAGLVYYVSRRIEVIHDSELAAINCRYVRVHDEAGVFVQGAVRAGLDYATKHNVINWIVDVADQVDAMSESDQVWENSPAFLQLFRDSAIRNILLVTAPSADQDNNAGARIWAADFAAELGADFRVGVASSVAETKEFFL